LKKGLATCSRQKLFELFAGSFNALSRSQKKLCGVQAASLFSKRRPLRHRPVTAKAAMREHRAKQDRHRPKPDAAGKPFARFPLQVGKRRIDIKVPVARLNGYGFWASFT
jgi:hypothetical protein